ncbi:helix-turn-helix domain-containing protein [Aurantimonas sp. 22II-16-19i]|uniref:MarR family winged helix-turn-helix transcriptional regulator n=1 Tax=Aurantimonas sp. 22II-16-19i TaxID=1317114 RepID=UPI0009F7D835|nr:helix-turn-helix domain-containing protein [Aurantimonas sp. 22II-16-19i]ORE90486.1 transcription regulator protein [Aurantimonas sp. 22II-16-19i]
MTDDKHSAEGAVLTDLVLEIFRLNGRLLAAGDRLVADVGLTSARWQVLGAIHYGEDPQTVSWLARSMGLTRQAVQRVVNELEADGLVAFKANPAHRRAQLVTLTREGRAAYAAADRRQTSWANALAAGFDRAELAAALDLLSAIRGRLEADGG